MTTKLPTYDQAAHGNVFAWLVATAKRVRAQRTGQQDADRFTRALMQRLGNQPAKL